MVYYFIDESGSGFSSEGIAILCYVVIDNPEEARSKITELRENILHDPRLERILGNFPIGGFHYTIDHFEIKNKFIELLKILTFQAYICFDPWVSCRSFNETYDRLFGRLIIDRLRDHKMNEINICFEQHNDNAERNMTLKAIIESKIVQIDRSERRVFEGSYFVMSATKDEPCLSITDYICGIFGAHFKDLDNKKETGMESLSERNFEDVRNKIRCIHDIKNNIFYSRWNPFH